MRTKLSSLVLAGLVSNNVAWGDSYSDCYAQGFNEGYQSCATCTPCDVVYKNRFKSELTTCHTVTPKKVASMLGNDLTLTLPVLLNANGETIINNPTQLKYYQKGLVTEITPQGFHSFTVDSLGGNVLANSSAKATLQLLVIGGSFSNNILPTISSENNDSMPFNSPMSAADLTTSCNNSLNSCELVFNFGKGNEKVSFSTPQNATWLGDCVNNDVTKFCNVDINKSHQSIALIFSN